MMELPRAGVVPSSRLTGMVEGIRSVLRHLEEVPVTYIDGNGLLTGSWEAMRRQLRKTKPHHVLVGGINDPSAMGALRAFEECAVDYILKPFDRARFERCLQQAKSRIRQDRQTGLASHLLTLLENLKQRPAYSERMAIKDGGRIVYVKTNSIEWVEAEGNYVRIHAGKSSYLSLGTIGGMEQQLDPNKFRRIHRGTIVNIDCIRELQPWFNGCYRVILHSGVELSLSRGYRGKQTDLL
jgi:hypothetical protein